MVKLYNVQLQLRIAEIGPLETPETAPSIVDGLPKDSPLKDAAIVLETFAAKALPARVSVPSYFPGTDVDGMAITESVQVPAESFEQLQGILKQFHDLAQSLSMKNALERLHAMGATRP